MAPCPFPYTVKRFKNVKVLTKGGFYRTVRQFVGTASVPCGKCVACRRRKQNEWAFRCMVEARHSKKSYFVTLTYDDDNVPFTKDSQMTLNKDHLQKHIKSLRDDLGVLKFYGCGEYGDQFGRPHYHYLLFLKSDLDDQYVEDSIRKRWQYGIIKVDKGVTPANARYCCKYALKQVGFDYGDSLTPFALMSRRPGIGNDFDKEVNYQEIRKRDQWIVHDPQGSPVSMPRRYQERCYTENERLEHSILMSKVYGRLDDIQQREYLEQSSDLTVSDFGKFTHNVIFARENNFIKQLKKERYGYKFTPHYRNRFDRQFRPVDDLETDEF